ncbi:MAG TPA: M20/M25/M40 family metallo-hydrolase [Longimicrobium sp.]|nr:M20/M25/M40 family metallo-hydrolase [Longimicrobium sp.]
MKRILTIAGMAALAACASGTAGPGPSTGSGTGSVAPPPAAGATAVTSGSAAAAAGTITAEDMRRHVAYLASDALRGRDTPSPGLDSAAAYLAREFARLGLQGGMGQGGFIQRYPLRGRPGVMAPNVVAVFPGGDPTLRNEYVVLSAHMDHVGVGRPVRGDSIYNGADDDASGTSALVEVAEAFASMPQRPARSILFLAVSGEEKGLLGSAYYSDHPTVPIGSIVANVNIDMIGRNEADSVVVIGKNYSSLGDVVQRVAAENQALLGLAAGDDRWPDEGFFGRSDHFNFARKEIPAIFFFAGPHEDYHQPSDEVEVLDTDKAARVARMVFLVTHSVATTPQRPRWTPAGLREVRRLVGGRD